LAKQLARDVISPATPDSDLRHIEVLQSRSGAPFFRMPTAGSALQVSIAHTTTYVAAGVSATGRIGVDVERVDSCSLRLARYFVSSAEMPLLDSLLGGGESAFTALWALKEAALKALAVGFSRPPSAVSVDASYGLRLRVAGESGALAAWVEPIEDHVLAVAAGFDRAEAAPC